MTRDAEMLKKKLSEWRKWMDDEDPHSIKRQIYQMVWDDAVYRIINECRRLAPPAEGGGVQLNGTVHSFIDRCHFRLQPLAIRRLIDKRSDVISLGRLLDDIKKHAGLLTRAAFFEAEGLAYDYSEAKAVDEQDQSRRDKEARARGTSAFWVDLNLENAWRWPEEAHQDFDRFSGVAPDARSKSDKLLPEFVEALLQELNVCNDVREYVNKQVAHAGDAASRNQLSEEARKLSLIRIEECHKAIYGVTSFVSVYFLRGPQISPLAISPDNQFAWMEKPWIREEDIPQLMTLWEEFDEHTHEWGTPEWPPGWD